MKQLNLQDVIEGRIRWSMIDPTMPFVDDGEVPEPGAFPP